MNKEVKFYTRKEDYERIGIQLTQEQYEDLCGINLMMQCDKENRTPIHYILLIMQVLGIIPQNDVENKFNRVID